MTSKEFLRKVFFFRSYVGAFDLFSSVVKPIVIWKVDMYGSEGERCTRFTLDLPNLGLLFYNFPFKFCFVLLQNLIPEKHRPSRGA